jgi:hypothetical protein
VWLLLLRISFIILFTSVTGILVHMFSILKEQSFVFSSISVFLRL